jgi:hypothetical protein
MANHAWISVEHKLPTLIHSVVVWVIGEHASHLGDQYLAIGIYRPDQNDWRVNDGLHDKTVVVSHWLDPEWYPNLADKPTTRVQEKRRPCILLDKGTDNEDERVDGQDG